MSQTRRDQQRFTISEVAADWHEPMVPQRIMWPSIARANGQWMARYRLCYELRCLLHCNSTEKRLTLYGHIKTAQQQTIIQQYGDWYAGRWWVGCYVWYSEEWPGHYSTWHYNYIATVKG